MYLHGCSFNEVNITWNKLDNIKSSIKFRLNFLQPCPNLGLLLCFGIRKELLLFFLKAHTQFIGKKKVHQERLYSVTLRASTLGPDITCVTLGSHSSPFAPVSFCNMSKIIVSTSQLQGLTVLIFIKVQRPGTRQALYKYLLKTHS